MRNLKKGKILLTAIITTSLLGISGNVKAGFQSRPNVDSKEDTFSMYFFSGIRQMETEGGTLGKSAVLESTTYLDKTGNGVDVHMARNTEWGTAAMLAASIYGQAASGTVSYDSEKISGTATTGNATGIYQMADGMYEYVSGIWNNQSNTWMSTIAGADERYKDVYTSTTSKNGDATIETSGWKGSDTNSTFISSSNNVFLRGKNALFSYGASPGWDSGYAGEHWSSRAVLVLGAGL